MAQTPHMCPLQKKHIILVSLYYLTGYRLDIEQSGIHLQMINDLPRVNELLIL
jgi:hypothetical protein